MRTLGEEAAVQGFNLKVSYRDEKTGVVVKNDPYTLRVISAPGGGKTRLWERPVGSGNLFDYKNNPIGRWVDGSHVKDAAHVAYIVPETQDQKLAKELTSKEARISELEKELNLIRSEASPKKTESFIGLNKKG